MEADPTAPAGKRPMDKEKRATVQDSDDVSRPCHLSQEHFKDQEPDFKEL